MRKNSRWAQSGMAAILGVSSISDDNDGLASRWGLKAKPTSGRVC